MDEREKENIRNQISTKRIYYTPQYKKWRMKTFKRDRFECQFPGCNKKGGSLQAHHIKPKYKYPEKIFDPLNGITLCYECHQGLHARKEEKKYARTFRSMAKKNKPKPRVKRIKRLSKIRR